MNFQLEQRTKILSGVGAIHRIGELVAFCQAKKAFLVCDKGTVGAGIVGIVTGVLDKAGIDYFVFDGVEPDPPVEVVEKGSKICTEESCDLVIGLGGGSSIDTGKAINLLRFNKGPITRYAEFGTPMKSISGFIAIPTTAGTGSEVSDGIVLTDKKNNSKFAILSPEVIPEFAVVDPSLMRTMPKSLTASTGLDVLAHVVEGYTTNLSNGYSDLICEKTIETVIEYLPRAYENGDDMEAREKMAVAATLGGWMLAQVHCHLGHAMAHGLGGKVHVPHGLACAWALPYAMEHIAAHVPEKARTLIRMLDGDRGTSVEDGELGAVLRDLLIRFRNNLDVVPQLRAGDEKLLDEAAEAAEKEVFQIFSHRQMSAEDVRSVFERMFNE